MPGPDAFRMLTDDLDHPEGVAWGPDGRIWAGGEDGQIYAVTLDGEVEEVANTGGGILGLALDGDGRVYACDEGRSEVVRVDPDTGEVEVYSSGTSDEPMRLPNWLCFDDAGNLYVTDSGESHGDDALIYRVAPGGETTVWTRRAEKYANGCCLDADGEFLYVAESYRRAVSRFRILSDGSAGERELVVDLPGTVPDGVALDAAGVLYVACYRPDRIYRVPPGGEPQVLADDPDGNRLNAPTNIAFVGAALDRVAVANVGEWHLLIGDVGAQGLPLRYPKLP